MSFLDPDYRTLTSDQLQLVDQFCGEFEQRRLDGQSVRIEELVAAAPEAVRSILEIELVRIELEIAATWHQLPALEDLVSRFPNSAEPIWTEWNRLVKGDAAARSVRSVMRLSETQGIRNHPTPPAGKADAASRTAGEVREPTDSSQRFRILRRIAEGGIGTVFAAFDKDLQREVALKELKGSLIHNKGVVSRFLVEATVTSHLEHPNIVPIYAVGQRTDGRHFYAMRFIRGQSMQAAIAQLHHQASKVTGGAVDFRRVPEARDLLLRFVAVCRAIGFAHSRGVIHRDLKPANIMVGDFGETLVVDWGLARRRDLTSDTSPHRDSQVAASSIGLGHHEEKSNSNIDVEQEFCCDYTRDGTIVGTPGYMSPEQSAGQAGLVDEKSDIYSLGATLFCMLTNAVPVIHTEAASHRIATVEGTKATDADPAAHETINSAVKSEYAAKLASPRRIIAGIPKELDAICRRAMAIRQIDRYRTTEEMARDLEAWLADEPVSVLPESTLQKTRRWMRQRPLLVGSSAASVVIATLAMAVTLQVVSSKNTALIQASEREKQATQNAQKQAQIAATNANDAEKQRQKIQEILHAFITDVERSLANVPGSAVVRKRVLTQVLNQLSVVSDSIRGNPGTSLSSVMALTDLGDLFAQFGTDDISGSIRFGELESASPSDAASKLYDEAMQVVDRQLKHNPNDLTAILQKSNIQCKQAALLRQTGRTAEAMSLITTCTKTRETHFAANPDSLEWGMAAAIAYDMIGQIHLQNGELDSAESQFLAAQKALFSFRDQIPSNEDLMRQAGIVVSRLGDIAAKRGDLEKAESFYTEDMTYSEQLARAKPENLTAQRDYSTAIDRIGNMSAARGRLEEALEFYSKSRTIREEILLSDPADQTSLRELFVSCMKCGDTRMTLKRVAEAKVDFVTAGEMAEKMAEIDAKSTVARRFQSFSAEMLADIALAEEDFDNALKYAVRSLDVSVELAAIDESDQQAQQDILLCHAKVAKVYQAKNDFTAAIAQFRLAEDIANRKLERNPSLDAKTDVIYIQAKIAETFLQAADPTQAETMLASAIALLEAIPPENRSDVTLRRRMVNLPTLRAQALIQLNRPEEARVLLESAKKLAQEMIQNDERAEQLQLDLDEIETLLKSLSNVPAP
ncbi:MAG: protein kinase [Planctomycetaceae bacterium]